MFVRFFIILVLSLTGPVVPKRCPCEKYQPIGGGNDAAPGTEITTRKTVKLIAGSVRARAMRGESYESTIARIHVYLKSRDSYPFVAACETDVDGTFCFNNLAPATYLVCAENRIFSPECALVTVRPKIKRSGRLKFKLNRLPI